MRHHIVENRALSDVDEETAVEQSPLLQQREYRSSATKKSLLSVIACAVLCGAVIMVISINSQTNGEYFHSESFLTSATTSKGGGTVCNLSRGDFKCSHHITTLETPAGADGRWEKGMKFVLMKDTVKLGGGIDIIYSELGTFQQSNNFTCDSYVTQLCLHGDHILYTNADFSKGKYVEVCHQQAVLGKILEFRLEDGDDRCSKYWSVDEKRISVVLEAAGLLENKVKVNSLLVFSLRNERTNIVPIACLQLRSRVPLSFMNLILS